MNRPLASPALLAALASLAALAAITATVAVRAADDGGAEPERVHNPNIAHLAPSVHISFAPRTPPELPSFVTTPPPAEASPAPRPEEWKDAPAVHLDHDVGACHAYRVREWVKIHCAGLPFAGASLLAGQREGVAIWVDPAKDDDTMKTLRGVELIFPVRRGDGRLFQIGQFGEGYDGPVAWNLVFTVSEQWIEGDKAPALGVR